MEPVYICRNILIPCEEGKSYYVNFAIMFEDDIICYIYKEGFTRMVAFVINPTTYWELSSKTLIGTTDYESPDFMLWDFFHPDKMNVQEAFKKMIGKEEIPYNLNGIDFQHAFIEKRIDNPLKGRHTPMQTKHSS